MMLAVAALVASCGGIGGQVTADRSGSNAAPSLHGLHDAPPTQEPDTQDYIAEFGQAYEWDNGLLIRVSEPEPFKPSQFACCPEDSAHTDSVMLTVKIVNGTNKPYSTDDWFFATLLAGTTEAEPVWDEKLDELSTRVLPGREAMMELAFMVETTEPERMQFDVTPGGGLATISWVGQWE